MDEISSKHEAPILKFTHFDFLEIQMVLSNQAIEGAFRSVVNIPKAFSGRDEDLWIWIVCDTPTLICNLLSLELGSDPHVQRAIEHLIHQVNENGWRCVSDPKLGEFLRPGRRVHHSFPDPAETIGSDEEILVAFRMVRDAIAKEIAKVLEQFTPNK